MRPVLIALVVAATSAVGAQGPPQPAFEVASVRLNRTGDPLEVPPHLQPGGRVFAVNTALRDMIQMAFGVRENELIGKDPLLDTFFDIEARTAATATVEQATAMLRRLLEDRFALRTHQETRELPVYFLQRANASRLGPRIKPSGPACAELSFPSFGSGGPPPPPPPPPPSTGNPLGPTQVWARCPTMFFPGGISARAIDMHAFSLMLARMVRRPVIDRTGLSGEFDFDLAYTPDSLVTRFPSAAGDPADGAELHAPASSQQGGPSLLAAIREQLGLRLESTRAPVRVLVIDRVQPPTGN